MELKDEIIKAYLQNKDIRETGLFSIMKGYKQPDIKRKEVVEELLSQLKDIVAEFPTFNETLWNTLFTNMDILDKIQIIPVVGSDPLENRVVKQGDGFMLILDLIHIANYTQIISQMVYIMQNYITMEVAKICIHEDYPLASKNYPEILNYMTFTNGLSTYLAWNVSCNNYKFYTEKYEEHKEKAFGLLSQSQEVDNKALQHKILVNLLHADFWNQFTNVAGMFYFDDIYRDLGVDGIKLLYKHGPKNFIHTIFHTV